MTTPNNDDVPDLDDVIAPEEDALPAPIHQGHAGRPELDDQMKHEVEDALQARHPDHGEEHRQTEPWVDDTDDPAVRSAVEERERPGAGIDEVGRPHRGPPRASAPLGVRLASWAHERDP
ncbi:hypothetical protein [Kocuria sp. NPDC057446]|uniref:hypothetical protein n=1 Tax=Kocuria sp. NPDC057446 TaxID=3346137 RepID=UPI0036AEA584